MGERGGGRGRERQEGGREREERERAGNNGGRRETMFPFTLLLTCRISGGVAPDRNIHDSVSKQIKANAAKLKWKVSAINWKIA